MEQLGREVNTVSQKLRHAIDSIKSPHDLSIPQTHVLGHLANHDIVYQSDFEELFHIRRSSVSSILSNLEGKGYIERYTDKEDTRKKRVVLTELGRKVEKDSYNGTIVKVEKELYNCLTEEERVALLKSLGKMSIALDKIQKEGLDD